MGKDEAMDNRVKVWPSIGLAFSKQGNGGAWRAWVVARYLDKSGRGWVERKALRKFLLENDVRPRNVERWTRDAYKIGLFKKPINKQAIYIASLTTAARFVGLRSVGDASAVELGALLGRHWKSSIFAGYLSAYEGKPRSRRFLTLQTGIPARTQRHYCKIAGVGVRPNYLIVSPGDPRGILGKGIFAWRDIGNKRNSMMSARRLSNIYVSPFARGRKGRAGKVNRELRSCIEPRPNVERLYYADPSAAQLAKLVEDGRVAYKLRSTAGQVNQWAYIGATA